MPETIKKEALQLEPALGSYEASKFSNTFPMEKPFKYKSLKLPTKHMFVTCVVKPDKCHAPLTALLLCMKSTAT